MNTCAWCRLFMSAKFATPIKVPVTGVVVRLMVHHYCVRDVIEWALFVTPRNQRRAA